jgi:hypothetical protein
MSWKDSGDAVVYPDGSLVKGPKALCELQGYVWRVDYGTVTITEEWIKGKSPGIFASKIRVRTTGSRYAPWAED